MSPSSDVSNEVAQQVTGLLSRTSRVIDRQKLLEWDTAAAMTIQMTGQFDQGLQTTEAFFDRINWLFIRSLEREQNRSLPRPIGFRLGTGLRTRLGDIAVENWLRNWNVSLRNVQELLNILDKRFAKAQVLWQELQPSTRTLLQPLADFAASRRTELREAHVAWMNESSELIYRLPLAFKAIATLVLVPWDQGGHRSLWDILLYREMV